MARTQKNKATSGHLGGLKARSQRRAARAIAPRRAAQPLVRAPVCAGKTLRGRQPCVARGCALPLSHARLALRVQAKLAKLRREILEPSKVGGGGKGEGFDVTKVGDSRVGLVGARARLRRGCVLAPALTRAPSLRTR
jgi:ribosome-interacting GTPase 1